MYRRRISTISTEDLCNFTDITAGMKVDNTDRNQFTFYKMDFADRKRNVCRVTLTFLISAGWILQPASAIVVA